MARKDKMERDIIITNMDKSSEIPRGKPEVKRAEGAGRRANPQEARDRLDFIKRKAEAFKGETELSFSEALGISGVVNRVNEGKEVQITPEELTGFKKIAERIFEPEDVAKMEPAQVLVAAHDVLTRSAVSKPEEADWEYSVDVPARREEEASAREQIAKAKEAELDPQRTTVHLEVIQEKIGKVSKKGGPGTMGTADEEEQIEWIANLPNPEGVNDQVLRRILREFKGIKISELTDLDGVTRYGEDLKEAIRIMREMKVEKSDRRVADKSFDALREGLSWIERERFKLTNQLRLNEKLEEIEKSEMRDRLKNQARLLDQKGGSEWQKNEMEIVNILKVGMKDEGIELEDLEYESEEIKSIFETKRVLKDEEGILGRERFEQIVTQDQKLEFRLIREKMEKHFEAKLKDLGDGGKVAMLGDISATVKGLFTQMSFQRISMANLRGELERILDSGMSREDPEHVGIRRWFLEKQMENLGHAMEIRNRTEIQADPYENIKSVYSAMNFFETIGSVEAFGVARDRLRRLKEAIDQSSIPDNEKKKVDKQIEAWIRATPLLIYLDEVKGDPRKMNEHADREVRELTMHHYYDRAYEEAVDERNRPFLVDEKGRDIYVDAFNRVYHYDPNEKVYLYKPSKESPGEPSEKVIYEGERFMRIIRNEIEEYENPDTKEKEVFTVLKDNDGKEEKDGEGRQLFKDKNGNYYYKMERGYFYKVDDNPEHDQKVEKKDNKYFREDKAEILLTPLNMLSEFENAFIEEYENDRQRVNKIQEATKSDLKWESPNGDVQWLISYTLGVNKPSSKYYRYYDSKTGMFDWADLKTNDPTGFNELQGKLKDVNKWWGTDDELSVDQNGISKTALALMMWYRTATYTGAEGVYGSYGWETGKDIGEMRQVIFESRVIHGRLKARLIEKGVDEKRLNDLLRSTKDSADEDGSTYNLLQAMTWSGSNLARLKMADGMDRFRFYNKNKEHVYTLFGLRTPYSARNASHPFDYFLNEHHGDRDVNRNTREAVEKEYGGFFNANLYTMVRMYKTVRYDMNDENDPLWKAISAEADGEMKRIGSGSREDVLDQVIAKAFYDGEIGGYKMTLSNVNWALGSKRVQGHEVADFYNDKADALEMYEKKYKEYSLQPFEPQLVDMLGTNWSRRDIRRHRNAELWLRAHAENGKLWKKKFRMKDNITNADMEHTINTFVTQKFIDEAKGERAKKDIVGTPTKRFLRQVKDFAKIAFDIVKSPGYAVGRIGDLFAWLGKYIEAWFKYMSSLR